MTATKSPRRKTLLARDLMSRPLRRLTTVSTVKDAADFMVRWKISGAPVIDEHGRWVGVFTMHDIARHIQERLVRPRVRVERTLENRASVPAGEAFDWQGFEQTPVAEVMSPGLVTVFPEATLDEVIRSLNSLPIHRVFVLDEKSGELLGIITTRDILRRLA